MRNKRKYRQTNMYDMYIPYDIREATREHWARKTQCKPHHKARSNRTQGSRRPHHPPELPQRKQKTRQHMQHVLMQHMPMHHDAEDTE